MNMTRIDQIAEKFAAGSVVSTLVAAAAWLYTVI